MQCNIFRLQINAQQNHENIEPKWEEEKNLDETLFQILLILIAGN